MVALVQEVLKVYYLDLRNQMRELFLENQRNISWSKTDESMIFEEAVEYINENFKKRHFEDIKNHMY